MQITLYQTIQKHMHPYLSTFAQSSFILYHVHVKIGGFCGIFYIQLYQNTFAPSLHLHLSTPV